MSRSQDIWWVNSGALKFYVTIINLLTTFNWSHPIGKNVSFWPRLDVVLVLQCYMFSLNITKSISRGKESISCLHRSPRLPRPRQELETKIEKKIKHVKMSDPWGERVNRALFINFSPPMGDNLWLASKGQMLIESETPRCSFRKRVNALGNNCTSSFFTPLIHCFGGQKRR